MPRTGGPWDDNLNFKTISLVVVLVVFASVAVGTILSSRNQNLERKALEKRSVKKCLEPVLLMASLDGKTTQINITVDKERQIYLHSFLGTNPCFGDFEINESGKVSKVSTNGQGIAVYQLKNTKTSIVKVKIINTNSWSNEITVNYK